MFNGVKSIASLLSCVPILLTTACSAIPQKATVDVGMTPTEVGDVMGSCNRAIRTEHEGKRYVLQQYADRYCNRNVARHNKCDFYIIYQDEKVVETGVTHVRGNPPEMQWMHLFHDKFCS